jgi:sterol desaturase/sphingolipid hydroxylase (fatty acid hydroxylase superfamily)
MISKGFDSLLSRVAESKVNYWACFVGDVLAALVFFALGLRWYSGSWISLAALVGAGLFFWSFMEYVLHRWGMHGPTSVPNYVHSLHHVNSTALVSTPAFVVAGHSTVVCVLLGLILPSGVAPLFVFGAYAGYNYFAIFHHVEHHSPGLVRRLPHFRQLARYHAVHHGTQTVNFGTTGLFWDRVFGTFRAID